MAISKKVKTIVTTNPEAADLLEPVDYDRYVHVPEDGGEDNFIPQSEKGQPGGVATLGEDGKVPQEQLPDIDAADAVKYTEQSLTEQQQAQARENIGALAKKPDGETDLIGADGKMSGEYLPPITTEETDPTVPEWAKQPAKPAYTPAEIGAEPAFTKKSAFNKDFGDSAGTVTEGNDARLSDIRTPKPHAHGNADLTGLADWAKEPSKPTYTKAEVGLGSADNTSDANKPVSTAQAAALATKVNISDVINDLISINADKPLSAAMGKLLNEIASGKTKTFIFSSQSSLDMATGNWTNSVTNPNYYNVVRNNGDVALIIQIDTPDKWWDGLNNTWQPMETAKVDLTGYATESWVDTRILTRAPYAHAATAPEYGAGTDVYYGHVKLNSSTPGAALGAAWAGSTGKAADAGHVHPMPTAAQVFAEPAFTKNTAFNKNFGNTAGTVCEGNDARLSDARPASGGNADTVDNKHASDFATAAQGAKADTALQSETDPTVPSWAKAAQKPTYTPAEVGAAPASHTHPTGQVTGLAAVATSGAYDDLSGKPVIPAEQIQTDWNQSNIGAKDYIKNKPSIPPAYTLPQAGAELGGIKADAAQEWDIQPVRIGEDGKMYTAPGGGGEGWLLVIKEGF